VVKKDGLTISDARHARLSTEIDMCLLLPATAEMITRLASPTSRVDNILLKKGPRLVPWVLIWFMDTVGSKNTEIQRLEY
jgi:hypothetical protein